MAMTLKVEGFEPGGPIPEDFAFCALEGMGGNRNPRLHWEGVPDGTRSFWGLSKKALGQSLPWLGLLALLLRPQLWQGRSRSFTCALIFTALFMLPFLIRSWHGGMSSNMRYFLPALPVLSILAATLIHDLLDRDEARAANLIPAILLGSCYVVRRSPLGRRRHWCVP